MADIFEITVDSTALRESFLTLNQALRPFVKAAAKESAEAIAREQRARLGRQLSGTSTGKTVASIVVRSDRTGWGWVVMAGKVELAHLAFWLERGTVKMKARPFFDAAAKLEAGAHQRRIEAAVRAAIHEHGLGDR